MKRLLIMLLAATTLASAAPRTVNYAVRDSEPLRLDIHHPTKTLSEPHPVILWIHGGGWQNGSRENWKLVSWLTEHGFAIVSIDYRLTDVAPFPAQIDDCRAALRWIREHGKAHQLNPNHVIVAGLSAGAHLATLLAVSLPDKQPAVSGILHFYGPSDFVQMARYAKDPNAPLNLPDSNVYRLLGGPLKDRLALAKDASPVIHLDEQDPAVLILVGTNDSLMTQRQCRRLHEAALETGMRSEIHKIEGAGHGGPQFSDPERQKLILEFLTSIKP